MHALFAGFGMVLGLGHPLYAQVPGQRIDSSDAAGYHVRGAVPLVLTALRSGSQPFLSVEVQKERRALLLHLQFDNPCVMRPSGTFRVRRDTLTLTLAHLESSGPCPGIIWYEAFAGAIEGVRPGPLFVRVTTVERPGSTLDSAHVILP